MATAPSSLRTIAGNLCLGSAPDSWGVWFPEDEHQVSYTRFLAPGVPLPIAVSTREHLVSRGLTGTRRPTLDR